MISNFSKNGTKDSKTKDPNTEDKSLVIKIEIASITDLGGGTGVTNTGVKQFCSSC